MPARVKWTCLPSGFDRNGRLLVSVFVSPELIGDPNAARIDVSGTVFRDWPQVLQGLNFDLRFGGAADTGTQANIVTRSSGSTPIWAALLAACGKGGFF
jgi:hypothetical protein